MARNRQADSRQTADERVKSASEMGAHIFTLSTRAAEQSVAGFSRMVGLGQSPSNVVEQTSRAMVLMQNWAVIAAGGFREISSEYMNWLQSNGLGNLTSLTRIMQSRTPDQLLSAHNQLLGENIARLLILNGRIAEISKEMVDRTADRITELAEETDLAQERAV